MKPPAFPLFFQIPSFGMVLKKWPLVWIVMWFSAATIYSLFFSDGGEHRLQQTLQTPTSDHWLGCDAFGRDMILTALRASLISAAFAFGAVIVSGAVAIFLASGCVLWPGALSYLVLRGIDLLLAFPALLFALAWAAVRGPGWGTLTFSLLIGSVPPLVRMAYARAVEVEAQDFVLAARSLGADSPRVFRVHLAPAVASFCLIKLPQLFAGTLLSEAILSFLGIGAPIGRDTWGSILAQGKDYLIEAPHLALGAGIPLFLTVYSLQIISEQQSDKKFNR